MKENAVVSCIFDPSHVIGKVHCLRKNRVQLTVMWVTSKGRDIYPSVSGILIILTKKNTSFIVHYVQKMQKALFVWLAKTLSMFDAQEFQITVARSSLLILLGTVDMFQMYAIYFAHFWSMESGTFIMYLVAQDSRGRIIITRHSLVWSARVGRRGQPPLTGGRVTWSLAWSPPCGLSWLVIMWLVMSTAMCWSPPTAWQSFELHQHVMKPSWVQIAANHLAVSATIPACDLIPSSTDSDHPAAFACFNVHCGYG